jgi:hypothetical protein
MNDQTDSSASTSPAAVSPVAVTSFVAAARPMSKRQIKASALEDERAANKRWKTMLPDAKVAWAKVSSEELAKVNGNVHVLAGLIQLRYHTSRQDADQQVQLFLSQHSTLSGAANAAS